MKLIYIHEENFKIYIKVEYIILFFKCRLFKQVYYKNEDFYFKKNNNLLPIEISIKLNNYFKYKKI